MADPKHTLQLKQELEREEAMLKNIKDKLLDQLQRLKVEELALMNKYMSTSNSTILSQAPSTTGSYFNTNIQGGTDTNEVEVMNEELNSVPLIGLTTNLTSNLLISSSQAEIDEEEEDDDE